MGALTTGVRALGHVAALPAHGVGSRKDLPLPFTFVLVGASAALVISFVALGVFWRRPRLHAAREVALPRAVARALDGRVLRGTAAALAGALSVWTLVALALGPDGARNPAPYVAYVWLWVGLVAVSLLLGPVWSVLNPVRWLHLGLCRVLALDPDASAASYRLGYWPAAAGLFSFTWLELIAPERTSSLVLGLAVATYVALDLSGAVVFGRVWFRLADPFEVMSRLYGSLSVLGRGRDGGWVLRNPLSGLGAVPLARGLLATVVVLLAGTAYDALTGVPAWFTAVQSSAAPVLVQTAALLGLCLLIGGAVWVACRLGALAGATAPAGLATAFAPCLVPIAAGYVVAHYWSLAAFSGPYTLTLLTDPLGTGADLLGTAGLQPSTALIAPTLVATVQACGIVAGHLLGIVHAHERSLELFDRRSALLSQLPMVTLMVSYTCGGLLLLFSG